MGVPEGADLMVTPLSAPENHFFRIEGRSEIATDGSLSGEFILTAEGQSDASVRRMFTSNYRSEWKNSIERELLKVAPQAIIIDMDFGKPYEYQKDFIHITVKYTIPYYAIVTEEEIIFTPFVAANLFKRGMSHMYFNTSTKERNYAFRDRCSRLVELNETIKLPGKGKLMAFDFDEKIGDDIASFEGSLSLDGRNLEFAEKVRLSKRVYEAEDWAAFKKAVSNQQKFAETPIIIKVEN